MLLTINNQAKYANQFIIMFMFVGHAMYMNQGLFIKSTIIKLAGNGKCLHFYCRLTATSYHQTLSFLEVIHPYRVTSAGNKHLDFLDIYKSVGQLKY